MADDRGDERATPDSTTTSDEDAHTDEEKNPQKRSGAAHTANVDTVEPRDPDGEPEEDTTEGNSRDPTKQEESNQDADNNPPSKACHKTA